MTPLFYLFQFWNAFIAECSECADAVITSGMMISFNDKLLQLDKLSQHMSRVKENINNHIDHQLEQLLEDE